MRQFCSPTRSGNVCCCSLHLPVSPPALPPFRPRSAPLRGLPPRLLMQRWVGGARSFVFVGVYVSALLLYDLYPTSGRRCWDRGSDGAPRLPALGVQGRWAPSRIGLDHRGDGPLMYRLRISLLRSPPMRFCTDELRVYTSEYANFTADAAVDTAIWLGELDKVGRYQ